jgi:ABC-type transporter Mla subunit MlaD
MPASSVILLEQARATREQAAHVRRLMLSMHQRDVLATLDRFARELDERADELERKAAELTAAAGRTRSLSADLRDTLKETQAKLGKLQDTVKGAGPRGGDNGDEGGAT